MSLRILHVFRTPVGGLFRHVLDVARGQAERGHQVGLVCDSATGGERAETLLATIAPHLALGLSRIPMRRNPHPADLSALIRLAGICRAAAPDILHGHGSKGGLYARLVPSRGAARAYTPHGGSFHYGKGSPLHYLFMGTERLLARRTDVFLFESDYVRGRFDAFIGKTDRPVRVVRNGISADELVPVPLVEDPFDLLFIGELRLLKGVDTLIEAIGRIRRDSQRRLTLLIVGAGPDEARFRAEVARENIADAVTFAPPQPIRAALARARIMVVPSRAESLPYVILEAAGAAQPLIATDVGGIPEIFGPFARDLIKPDDVGALREAILRKLDESEQERRDAARALSGYVAAHFSIDGMVEGILAGYGAALAPGKAHQN